MHSAALLFVRLADTTAAEIQIAAHMSPPAKLGAAWESLPSPVPKKNPSQSSEKFHKKESHSPRKSGTLEQEEVRSFSKLPKF